MTDRINSAEPQPVFEELDESNVAVRDYVAARRAGFSVTGRHFLFDGKEFSSSLDLHLAGASRVIQSTDPVFHFCAFSHFFSTSGLFLRSELPSSSGDAEDHLASGALEVEVKCGLLSISSRDIKYLELRESSTRNIRARSYRFWVSAETAKYLSPVPSEPSLNLSIKMGGLVSNRLHGYVDQVRPFELGGEQVVEITGVDTFTGCRNLVGAKFNYQVDPITSIMLFAAWIDLDVFASSRSIEPVTLPGIEQFSHIHGDGPKGFRDFLSTVRESTPHESIERLCTYFDEVLAADPSQMTPLTAPAFQNLAVLVRNDLPVHLAVGSVRGCRASGIVQIAPGIVLAGPNQLPFGLIGESSERPLCESWDNESARLVAFFLANKAKDTADAGWAALKTAFDCLNVAVADAGWLHSTLAGQDIRFAVDGRMQDAILELDRWHHVHDLFSGVAHQYYASKDKSTNTLSVDDDSLQSLCPRLSTLMRMQSAYQARFPRLVSHLMNAVFWISRAKTSTTLGERFLCTWIAGEFLALRGDSDASDRDIKSTVSSSIATVMSKGERVGRRYWQSTIEDCYDLRCSIVHEAEEHEEKLTKLTPLLLQAVVEVVMHCSLSLPDLTEDTTPAELLDQSRKALNARARR